MEITQQPSTIGEMTPEHFQTFIIDIIKTTVYEITNPRFEAIEQRLDRLEVKFDRLSRNQDIIGALVLEHDNRLRDMAMA